MGANPPLEPFRASQWLLDLPHQDPVLRIRQYRVPSLLDSTSETAPVAESSNDAIKRAQALTNAEEALESAWRTINSASIIEYQQHTSDDALNTVLKTPSAIVVDSPDRRVLWVFELDDSESAAVGDFVDEPLKGLGAVDDPVTIPIRSLLHCRLHDQRATCLASGSICPVTFRPGDKANEWDLFAKSVVDKLAWRNGRRIALGSPKSIDFIKVSLRPAESDRLLLRISPHRSSTTKASHAASSVLLPLGLPAHYLAPHQPTSEQLIQLDETFSAALGSTWKDGRSKYRLTRQYAGHTLEADWGIFWVPVPTPHPPANAAGISPTAKPLAQGPEMGVLTVWPMHLVSGSESEAVRSTPISSEQGPKASATARSGKRQREPPATNDCPAPSDLLGIASGLFDFLSTYKEPPPPASTTETDSVLGDSKLETQDRGMDEDEKPGAGDSPKALSDTDGLFSSRSASPVGVGGGGDGDKAMDVAHLPSEQSAIGPPDDTPKDGAFGFAMGAGMNGDTDARRDPQSAITPPGELIDDDVNMEMESGMGMGMDDFDALNPPSRGDYSSKVSSMGNDEGMGGVTEDDFNFFDEPEVEDKAGDAGDGDLPAVNVDAVGEGGRAEEAAPDHVTQPGLPPFQTQFDEGKDGQGKPDAPITPQESAIDGPDRPTIHSEQTSPLEPSANNIHVSPTMPRTPTSIPRVSSPQPNGTGSGPGSGSEPRKIGVRFAPLPTPSPPPSPLPFPPFVDPYNLIPDAFSALPLAPSRKEMPSTAFLPSPAPSSPEAALRSDLVMRLQTKSRPATSTTRAPAIAMSKLDYASGWKLDNDDSEEESENDDTGAPPTPESEDEWEESTGQTTPAMEAKQGGIEGDEIVWEGVPCIGAQWVWMGDGRLSGGLARPWKASWGTTMEVGDKDHVRRPEKKKSVKRLKNEEMERLALEIISNRHFRSAWLSADGPLSTSSTRSNETMGYNIESTITPSLTSHPPLDIHVKQLETCNVHAGFAGNVVRLSIAGLGYWKQLGLSPVGGEKEVNAVVVTLPGEAYIRAANGLIKGLEKIWEEMRLGKIIPKKAGPVVLTELQSLGPTIDDARRSLAREGNSIVYVLLDQEMLAHPDFAPVLVSIQPSVPNSVVHYISTSTIQPDRIPELAIDSYNRIPRLLHKYSPDRLVPIADTGPIWLQHPTFTLASDSIPRPELTMSWPLRSYDVLNKWRIVHASYVRDLELGVVVAFVIDAEGENWDVRVWSDPMVNGLANGNGGASTSSTSTTSKVLEGVWEFFTDFASTTAIEWRLAVVRLGVMDEEEIQVWEGLPKPSTPFTLLMTELPDMITTANDTAAMLNNTIGMGMGMGMAIRPPVPPVNITPAMWIDPSSRLLDDSLAYSIGKVEHRVPVDLPSFSGAGFGGGKGANGAAAFGCATIYPRVSWVASMSTSGGAGSSNSIGNAKSSLSSHPSTTFHVLSHRPASGRTEEVIEEVLGREYQKMTYLAKERSGFEAAVMPLHLEAVRAVLVGLSRLSDGA